MSDMELLYEDFKKLREEIEVKNLDEIGAFELRHYRRRFEFLHRRNLELQESTRTSDIDTEELRQVLNLGDKMWYELGEALKPIVEVIDIKMALGKQVAEERTLIKQYKEENLKNLKRAVNRLKRDKKSVAGITDPAAKEILERKLREDEEHIQELKDLDADYDKKIKELGEKLKVIALGGKLPELEEIRKSSEGLDEDDAKDLAGKMAEEADEELESADSIDEEEEEPEETEKEDKDDGLPGIEFEDEDLDPIIPIIGRDTTHTDEEEEKEEPVPELDGEEKEEPVPEFDGEDEDKDKEHTPVVPIPVPVKDRRGGERPGDRPLPDPILDDDEEEPVPVLDDEEEEDNIPVRAEIRQPKPSLWSKIEKVLKTAATVLLAAIAVHTGLTAGGGQAKQVASQPADSETQEETEDEQTQKTETDKTEEKTDDTTETKTDDTTETKTEDTTETKNEDTTETKTEDTTETKTEDTTETKTEDTTETKTEDTTETKEDETPEQTSYVLGEGDVILSPGESVYDSTTGVEVGYTGAAALETESGYESQEYRDLTPISENQVVVTSEDLQPDEAKAVLPRTGQEIKEEEARLEMTEGESQNLDEAISEVDWEAFFNDGPTL